MKTKSAFAAMAVAASLATAASAQVAGQETGAGAGGAAEAAMGQSPEAMEGALEAAISTQLTWRSHSIGPNSSAGNLQGQACPSPTRMISGACHPGYNDRVIIINQFPNISANTWRCGFRNNNNVSRTVWIYTLCGQ